MSIQNIREFIKAQAEQFGAKTDNEFNKPYVERNNTGQEALNDNGAYFGFIHPEEEASGPFHDFSLTIFPNDKNKPWLICLGIGSSGFKNDYELATYPGLRRLFMKLINEKGFCKSDFSDIETGLPKSITGSQELQHIKNTIKTYTKVLPSCQIVDDPESEEGKQVISAFVAGYAKLRDWPSNKDHRKAITEALEPFIKTETKDEEREIKNLLNERKYIVLQGPPGTGKTRTAKSVADQIGTKTFFTQFHAETSFSDFIFGIRPDTTNEKLRYKEYLGSFSEALKYAVDNSTEKVILIIDEINRANLSNVLGPIFYLFEHKMDVSNVEIEISPNFKVKKLPDNFFVITTMNTADRSLAVVDFALRRRFAWYNKSPRIIKGSSKRLDSVSVNKITEEEFFFKEDFAVIEEIFNWYASSPELNLQPGEGYFIAKNEAEMLNRIRYEVFPLIKEYLQEGLLRSAKEEFNNYFSTRLNLSLFE
ncbi:MAG: AAA family ATPase [Algibacter sp.]|uniref:McrB family protein n=1 Tax=Algibacter sp. TaxID=1872428 RepID=UPI002634F2C3|nr:AAA family ATPase [Algibacter sp.]MDG1729345.1 AAA family ATPase [Algibacter sp.]MDG2177347.1 AAA family ATPase [Algibacter sp.]